MSRSPVAVLTLLFPIASVALAQPIPGVEGKSYYAPQEQLAQRMMRRQLPSLAQTLPQPLEIRLGALSGDERKRVEMAGQAEAKVAGVHRRVDPNLLERGRAEILDGERSVWRLALHSQEAGGLRVHFTSFDAGSGRVWVHAGTGEESEIHGPYTGKGLYGDGDFWSDVVLGETVVVEYEPGRPMGPGETPPFQIAEVSHLAAGALPRFAEDLNAGAREAAASCNLDVTCYPNWAETAKAVAHIVFERDGSSYVCSGTLVNTRSGRDTPYFLTAQHCIADDTTARSVSAFWSYQTSTCNGTPPNRRDVPRTLGARYLVGTPTSSGDGTLIQLNSIPSGVRFSGWDPNPPASGTQVAGIHHPNGDFKRISFGTSTAAYPYSGRDLAKFVGAHWGGGGLTEGGSSGSGLFSGSLQLVGMLSHGPKASSADQYCAMLPFTDNYGSFAAFYPVIRDYLEERTVGGSTPPPTPTPAGGALTPGQTRSLKLGPVTGNRLFNGQSGFTVTVPQGATRLEVTVRTATSNADVDLFVRFGQDVAIENGQAVADFKSEGSGGDEQVVVSGSQLRAGTYYIALGLFTPGVEVQTTLTANLTATQPPASTIALVSGQARNFTLGPVTGGTLYNGANGFTIAVPQGATRLEITLRTSTANTDVDLYARFSQDVGLSGTSAVADFKSAGATGDEYIVIAGSDLRAGTYYIAFGLLTTGRQAQCTITATVTTQSQPPTPGGNALISGQARNFSLGPVTGGRLYNGADGVTIAVPQGATRLEIALRTSTANVDVDLYARFGQDVVLSGSSAVADFKSEGTAGDEQIVVAGSDLRSGTYYIAFGLFTTGRQAQCTITVTVTTPSTPTPGSSTVLTSGQARNFSIGPAASARLFAGASGHIVNVPQGATRLEIAVRTTTPNADVDLYVSFGQDVTIQNGQAVADFRSESGGGDEQIVITGAQLRPGAYYVALGLFTLNAQVQGTIIANVTTTTTPPVSPALISGQARNITIGAVQSSTLLQGAYGYTIGVPQGATRLEITLRTQTANVDVDLYARFGQDVALENGRAVADFRSENTDSNEQIVISGSSLRPGAYYIALGVFTTGISIQSTLTATVTTTTAPPPSGAQTLASGTPASFRLGPVANATAFSGSRGYRIQVPQGATRLDVRLATTSPAEADVDLYVRFDRDIEITDGNVAADYLSEGPTGTERITATPQSSPALRPGTYYIAVGLYSTNVEVVGAITATVVVGGGTAPQTSTQLTSGVPVKFSLPGAGSSTLYSGNYSFRLTVPDGASKLTVQLRSDVPTADTDLFVRRDADNEIDGGGNVVTDYASTSPYADETVVIDAASEPPLRPGTYYVSVAVYTQGVPISGTILATMERTPVQTSGAQAVLRPEVPARFSLPAVGRPTLFTGDDAFRLEVPADTTRVDIILSTEPSTTDVDLFMRYGSPPAINSSQAVTADHSSTSDSGNEQITIDGSTRPVLRSGTYYIALGLYTSDTPVAGALTAVLYRGEKTARIEDYGAGLRPKPGIFVFTPRAQPLTGKNALAGKSDANSKSAPFLLKSKRVVHVVEE
ncbi:MAG: PPC domain-containing protein [Bryobacterales bacterium]|nr:PPC domain-containing protein [Bryobacterales bacterium]